MLKSFSEMSKNQYENGTVIVVDALNLAFSFRGRYDYLEKYVKMVESLRKSYKAKQVIMACDSGSSWFRKNIHPGYKGARKEKFAEQTEAEKLEFELFFKEFNNVIEHFKDNTNYPLFRFDKTEADDIAAYIVRNKSKFNINKIWLLSSDRDWDLLVQENVSRFSYVTRKEITSDNWNEHYECTQEEYISLKCLQGDPGDSVPGIPGVGPKRAIELIAKYGSAFDIADAIPLTGKQKFIQSLNEFGAENIMKNYKLMDLLTYCDEAIGPENCKIIDEVMKNAATN